MAKKINPFLAKLEADWEAKYLVQLDMNSEIDRMAFLLTVNEDLHVGPTRAKKLLNNFMADRLEIAEQFLSDAKDDPEVLHIKHDLATRLKEICGDSWPVVREYFPMLKIYW